MRSSNANTSPQGESPASLPAGNLGAGGGCGNARMAVAGASDSDINAAWQFALQGGTGVFGGGATIPQLMIDQLLGPQVSLAQHHSPDSTLTGSFSDQYSQSPDSTASSVELTQMLNSPVSSVFTEVPSPTTTVPQSQSLCSGIDSKPNSMFVQSGNPLSGNTSYHSFHQYQPDVMPEAAAAYQLPQVQQASGAVDLTGLLLQAASYNEFFPAPTAITTTSGDSVGASAFQETYSTTAAMNTDSDVAAVGYDVTTPKGMVRHMLELKGVTATKPTASTTTSAAPPSETNIEDPPDFEDMFSTEHLEKVVKRRERNREAARKCRKKRMDRIEHLDGNTAELMATQAGLRKELANLKKEKDDLEKMLASHVCVYTKDSITQSNTAALEGAENKSEAHKTDAPATEFYGDEPATSMLSTSLN